MTNEEAKATLVIMRDNCLSATQYDDPMRGAKHHALTMAIQAIENQAKYERALKLVATGIPDCDDCPVQSCDGNLDVSLCDKKIIAYFKRKAGFEQ